MSSVSVNDLFEGRPRRLFYIYWLHPLVEFCLIGKVLGAWM